MSYTTSKAQSGAGTILSQAAVIIGEVIGISQSGKQNTIEDTTNLQSSGEEFLATFPAYGKFNLTLNRIAGVAGAAGDPGQKILSDSWRDRTILPYTIVLGKAPSQTTSGDTLTFNALVEEYQDLTEVSPKKKITSTVGLKVTNLIVVTYGT